MADLLTKIVKDDGKKDEKLLKLIFLCLKLQAGGCRADKDRNTYNGKIY